MSLSALIAYASDSDEDATGSTREVPPSAPASSVQCEEPASEVSHPPLAPANAEKVSEQPVLEGDQLRDKISLLRKRLRSVDASSVNCEAAARQLAELVAERSGAKQTIAEVWYTVVAKANNRSAFIDLFASKDYHVKERFQQSLSLEENGIIL